MISNLTLFEAMSFVNDIPVTESLDLKNLAKRDFTNMTGSEKIGWITMALFTSATLVLEGLYFSQTSCYALSLIPGVGEITAAVCVTAAVASMIMTASAIGAATDGVIGFSGSAGPVSVNTRDLGGIETDFQDYNHYVNLSHWHGYFRSQGLNTNLVNAGSPLFYTHGGYLYGANTTSSVQMPGGHYVHVQHGLIASRMFVGVNQRSNNITKRDSIDPDGNGYDDEGFSNGDGYKGQWCHQHGSAESLDPVNDWGTVNDFVHALAGDGQTGNTDLWEFQVADSNHNDEQIANIVIEGETEGFGYNEEWSESFICAGQLSG